MATAHPLVVLAPSWGTGSNRLGGTTKLHSGAVCSSSVSLARVWPSQASQSLGWRVSSRAIILDSGDLSEAESTIALKEAEKDAVRGTPIT
jgi:hypothetical protein